MMDSLFTTLSGKTFILIIGSLFISCLSAYGVIEYFRRAAIRGKNFVKQSKLKDGEIDLVPHPVVIKKLFFPFLILNIISFLFLMIANNITVRLLTFAIFAFSDGLTIGLILLLMNERLGIRVLLLTIMVTLVTGFIGYFSKLNFLWLDSYLFLALFILIIFQITRLFSKIHGWKRRSIAVFGILIFIGYLLYDFDKLKASRGIQALNNWATAIDFSTNIYLDVINLFLEILDALSDD